LPFLFDAEIGPDQVDALARALLGEVESIVPLPAAGSAVP